MFKFFITNLQLDFRDGRPGQSQKRRLPDVSVFLDHEVCEQGD